MVVKAMHNYAEIQIRRAELSEVDAIKDILREAYKPIRKELSRVPGALKEGMDKIARHIQMGNQYVALVGNEIAGTMRVGMRGQVGVVSRMAVREKFRNRRIGTIMVEYADSLLDRQNAKCVEIEVYGSIDYQADFYDRMGFSEVERKERAGEEIIVMRKDLCKDEEIPEEDEFLI